MNFIIVHDCITPGSCNLGREFALFSGLGLRDGDIQQLPVCTLTALKTLDLAGNRLSHLSVQKLGENFQDTPLQVNAVLSLCL